MQMPQQQQQQQQPQLNPNACFSCGQEGYRSRDCERAQDDQNRGSARAVAHEVKQEVSDKRQWDDILGVCLINGREVNCTVDTGAVATIVQQRFVQEDIEKGNVKIEHCTERFVSANGVPVHIAGKIECDLQIGANSLKNKIYV